MYPSYNGMTPYVYALDDAGPGPVEKAWNFLTMGAVHYDLRAPADGEVVAPVLIGGSPDTNEPVLVFPKQDVMAAEWSRLWLLKGQKRQYTFFVGGQPVSALVPEDFDSGFDQAFFQTYFPEFYKQAWNDQAQFYRLIAQSGHLRHDGDNHFYIVTGHQLHAGDRALDFDLRTGDMLFVDRISYNFVRPKPGDPFVFHTGDIAGLPQFTLNTDDQYYIKRLVGVPGDQLEVRPPMLYRNGAPITGAAAFGKNGHREGEYPGYVNRHLLGPGQTVTVQPGYFWAMGDNSPFSLDSRYWEGVPAHSVVGRAIFIVYPFSFRWGLAK
jgi:signal peptidase I